MNNLEGVLTTLAEQISVPIEVLWAALMRQAFYFGVVGIGMYILLIALVVGVYYATKRVVKLVDDGEVEEIAYLWVVIGWGGIVVFGIYMLSYANLIVAAFCNPEYWAVEKILSLIGK